MIQEFRRLCLNAKTICDSSLSTESFEPSFLEVLNYAKQHPEIRDEMAEYFVKMLIDYNLGPWELIEFCMRELKWPEVRNAAQQRLECHRDFRIKAVMADIVEVYQEKWKDAEQYDYYREKEKGNNEP